MTAVEEIKDYLHQFKNTDSIIGIDGYSGIGKTTIADQLKKLDENIEIIHMDDYVVTANEEKTLMPQLASSSKELNLQWAHTEKGGFEGLKKAIEEARKNKKEIIVVEGIFLLHPHVLPGTFAKVVFLKGDELLADERRIEREKKRWGKVYLSENNPASYARLFKLAWKRYVDLYNPEAEADLVVAI